MVSVEDEYARSKDLRKDDVVALKEWVDKQPHLPTLSELQIIQFLQSCYFKIEPTKSAIDTFFSLKYYWPEYFADRNPNSPQLQQAINTGLCTVLPERTPEGYAVILSTLVDYEPSNFIFPVYIKLFDTIGSLWLAEHGTAEGVLFVIDMNHTTLSHLTTFNISTLRNLFCYLQEALPTRLKGLHYINTGVIMDKIMMLTKPFIKKELLEVLHTHPKVNENFFRFVPQHCLPSDFGGAAPSIAELHAEMKKKLLDNVDYILEQEKLMGDETKRTVKRNVTEEGYGVDGSFKRLDID